MKIVENSRSGRVTDEVSQGKCHVDFYHSEHTFLFGIGEYNGPTVNWGALGSVSIKDARTYAEMILKAADLAEKNHKPE